MLCSNYHEWANAVKRRDCYGFKPDAGKIPQRKDISVPKVEQMEIVFE
jgi:hypothetical protein